MDVARHEAAILLMHDRLTEQLWKKVTAYENLLLRNVSDLSQDQQSAIQRALLMVCTMCRTEIGTGNTNEP